MATLTDVLQEIANAASVVASTTAPGPGELVRLNTLVPSTRTVQGVLDLQGSLVGQLTGQGGGPLGTLTGSVQGPVVGSITAQIPDTSVILRYRVLRDGEPADRTEYRIFPPLVRPLLPAVSVSDPSAIDVLLRPRLAADDELARPVEYEIEISVTVTAGTLSASVARKVPITVPVLRLPTLLLLVQHTPSDATRYPGSVLVLVKPTSGLSSIATLLDRLNSVSDSLFRLRDVLELVSGGEYADPLGSILDVLDRSPRVWVHLGDAPDFNSFGSSFLGFMGGFDEQVSSLMLFGAIGTRVAVYDGESYGKWSWFGNETDSETYEITADHDIGGTGVPTGIGLLRDDSMRINDAVESAQWLPRLPRKPPIQLL